MEGERERKKGHRWFNPIIIPIDHNVHNIMGGTELNW